MAGKFEAFEDKSGKFRFRVEAGNGELFANSEGYESRSGAHKGAGAVQRAADGAHVVDV